MSALANMIEEAANRAVLLWFMSQAHTHQVVDAFLFYAVYCQIQNKFH